ncbi:hypothetical protein GCM10009608_84200 [Pseudonocardia alaniniphila]
MLGEPLPVELMNTLRVDRSDVQDALSDDAPVTAWLRAIDDRLRSETGSQDPSDVAAAPEPGLAERLRRVRDALCRLAADATGDRWVRPEAAGFGTALREQWSAAQLPS